MTLLQCLQRLFAVRNDVVVGFAPALDQLGERFLVRIVIAVGGSPATDDRSLRIIGRRIGELHGIRHLVTHGHVEGHPESDGGHRARNERCHRGWHGLVDQLDILGVDRIGA